MKIIGRILMVLVLMLSGLFLLKLYKKLQDRAKKEADNG